MADYQCYPLWYTDIFYCEDGTNVDPNNLNISKELKVDLYKWAALYDSTLNMDDPALSGFITIEDENDFKNSGILLAKRLQQELGHEYKIIFEYY
ncbi:hypothetical protein PT276_05720 [Orbaceae bacterium ESL0721]|nr:hypothetical protein [Orbaceae bacterium ESL0721]